MNDLFEFIDNTYLPQRMNPLARNRYGNEFSVEQIKYTTAVIKFVRKAGINLFDKQAGLVWLAEYKQPQFKKKDGTLSATKKDSDFPSRERLFGVISDIFSNAKTAMVSGVDDELVEHYKRLMYDLQALDEERRKAVTKTTNMTWDELAATCARLIPALLTSNKRIAKTTLAALVAIFVTVHRTAMAHVIVTADPSDIEREHFGVVDLTRNAILLPPAVQKCSTQDRSLKIVPLEGWHGNFIRELVMTLRAKPDDARPYFVFGDFAKGTAAQNYKTRIHNFAANVIRASGYVSDESKRTGGQGIDIKTTREWRQLFAHDSKVKFGDDLIPRRERAYANGGHSLQCDASIYANRVIVADEPADTEEFFDSIEEPSEMSTVDEEPMQEDADEPMQEDMQEDVVDRVDPTVTYLCSFIKGLAERGMVVDVKIGDMQFTLNSSTRDL